MSNDLDEYSISSILAQGAKVDSWGVGTKLATAFGQPTLGGVYKLSATCNPSAEGGKPACWIDHMKVSAQTTKRTIPGVLDIRRYFHEDGKIAGDMIYDVNDSEILDEVIVDPFDDLRRKDLSGKNFETLLEPLAIGGKLVFREEYRSVSAARLRVRRGLFQLDESQKRLFHPHTYPVGLEGKLHIRRHKLACEMSGYNA